MRTRSDELLVGHVHEFVVADDLDGHFDALATSLISRSDDIGENSLTSETKHFVSIIQHLADVYTYTRSHE